MREAVDERSSSCVGLLDDPLVEGRRGAHRGEPLLQLLLRGLSHVRPVIVEAAVAGGIPVIKAIKVKDSPDVDQARAYAGVAAMVLFDARAPDALADALPGGNGIAFDWSLLDSSDGSRQFILSGGLDCSNVAEAIHVTGAPVVDVSSGVERAPGIKDAGLIRKFIEAARSARSERPRTRHGTQ